MTTVHKYLPVDEQGVSKHERVVLDISQQEAALLSLLLGSAPAGDVGDELYNALEELFPVFAPGRREAMHHMERPNTRHTEVLAYLGQFPGE